MEHNFVVPVSLKTLKFLEMAISVFDDIMLTWEM